MVPRTLNDRINELVGAAYAPADAKADAEYQALFEQEGFRKAQYIVDDLLAHEKKERISTGELVYVSVGGADGSEVEHVLRHTQISRAILVEVSEHAAKLARVRAQQVRSELQKEIRVFEGDVTSKLKDIAGELKIWKARYGLRGLVCSAQAVLHELPRRSPGFDLSVFFGTIFQEPDWNFVGFYAREPCKPPPGLPEFVQLQVRDVSGDALRRLALHVAHRLGMPATADLVVDGWVKMPGIVAIESLHKLLRTETIERLNYELEEQLTELDPALIEKILKDHVPGIHVSIEYGTTEGFATAVKRHGVKLRDSQHQPLQIPATHVHITAVFTKPASVARNESRFLEEARSSEMRSAIADSVYSNLPTPSYSRFIPRNELLGEIVEGLLDRTTPVVVTGMSGVGKTSLAHEVAVNCLSGNNECPRFDAVVWISDKGNPGSTTLNALLDEIARTLDYTGLTQLDLLEKRRKVEGLLRSQRVVLVIDSFETIRDPSLPQWLCNLPEPSKAIVTTQGQIGQFPRTVTEVHVPGMNEAETHAFVEQRLARLGLTEPAFDYSKLRPFLEITNGNAKAIELGLGLIKRRRRPLKEVIQDLRMARPPFDAFCSGAWNLLDTSARVVLLATHYFPYGTQDHLLQQVAHVPAADFDRSIDLLSDLALLDLSQKDLESGPTYSTHGLVRAFVEARLNEDEALQSVLRGRWLVALREITSGIGFCWDDIGRLGILDDPALRQTVQLAIEWSFEHAEYVHTIAIANDVRYCFYVRGLWSSDINLRRADAARRIGDKEEEFAALVYHINIAAKQRNLNEVAKHLDRLAELATSDHRSRENIIGYQHALGLYALARGEYAEAEQLWLSTLAGTDPVELPHAYSATTRWLASCLEKQGRLYEAHQLLDKALSHARGLNFSRGIVDAELKKANLYLVEHRYSDAATRIRVIEPLIEQIGDRLYETQYAYANARIHDARGDLVRAKFLYEKALDGFERLGLGDRADTTRAALQNMKRLLRAGRG
jgi:tetratricopeptide (TPR) repeat protein